MIVTQPFTLGYQVVTLVIYCRIFILRFIAFKIHTIYMVLKWKKNVYEFFLPHLLSQNTCLNIFACVVCILRVSYPLIVKTQIVNMHLFMGYNSIWNAFRLLSIWSSSALSWKLYFLHSGWFSRSFQTVKNMNHNLLIYRVIHTAFYLSQNSDGQLTLKKLQNSF